MIMLRASLRKILQIFSFPIYHPPIYALAKVNCVVIRAMPHLTSV
jgi:hypothetical protein